MKSQELRKRWTEYVDGLNGLLWNIKPENPDREKYFKAITLLHQILGNLQSSEIEVGDLVTNGTEKFLVWKVENDCIYETENTFYQKGSITIVKKHPIPIK